MKVKIIKGVAYPIYGINPDYMPSGVMVEVTNEFFEDYQSLTKKFDEMQDILEELHKKNELQKKLKK